MYHDGRAMNPVTGLLEDNKDHPTSSLWLIDMGTFKKSRIQLHNLHHDGCVLVESFLFSSRNGTGQNGIVWPFNVVL